MIEDWYKLHELLYRVIILRFSQGDNNNIV